jgi:hypothetical protein
VRKSPMNDQVVRFGATSGKDNCRAGKLVVVAVFIVTSQEMSQYLTPCRGDGSFWHVTQSMRAARIPIVLGKIGQHGVTNRRINWRCPIVVQVNQIVCVIPFIHCVVIDCRDTPTCCRRCILAQQSPPRRRPEFEPRCEQVPGSPAGRGRQNSRYKAVRRIVVVVIIHSSSVIPPQRHSRRVRRRGRRDGHGFWMQIFCKSWRTTVRERLV